MECHSLHCFVCRPLRRAEWPNPVLLFSLRAMVLPHLFFVCTAAASIIRGRPHLQQKYPDWPPVVFFLQRGCILRCVVQIVLLYYNVRVTPQGIQVKYSTQYSILIVIKQYTERYMRTTCGKSEEPIMKKLTVSGVSKISSRTEPGPCIFAGRRPGGGYEHYYEHFLL